MSSRITNSTTRYGMLRVAAVVPELSVADVDANIEHLTRASREAVHAGAAIVVLPELGLTGYTAADLLISQPLLAQAKRGLVTFAQRTSSLSAIICVGLPLQIGLAVFNCAAVIHQGSILGIVPKTYIPNYKEFYEERWFASSRELTASVISIGGKQVPVGTDLLFDIPALEGATLAIEICEDLWSPLPPSTAATLAGATIVANLSASNDLVGKAEYRRQLIEQQSARAICTYIYTSCGAHESTTDVVFGGHALIAENGNLLSQTERFLQDPHMAITDADIEHLMLERRRTSSFHDAVHALPATHWRRINIPLKLPSQQKTIRWIDAHPFVPGNVSERDRRAQEILTIQATGLAQRMRSTNIAKLVLGLSGGLDSTLALLVAVRAMQLLKKPLSGINCITMPGFATSRRTKGNAFALAEALNVPIEEIPINATTTRHLRDIGHDTTTPDITYENAQARYRTLILMDRANQLRGLVVGTGDLSEIALGWCTFTGDQISHYGVNASVPKSLVRYVIGWAAEQPEFIRARDVLIDIMNTPVSPELIKAKGSEISQKTEDIVGPYELHDFFLYHLLRWASGPAKVLWLAEQAFAGQYDRRTIHAWLRKFTQRFFANQWKRSVMPDGPKVGSVALSPRGDWRMPSDTHAKMWLSELE